MSPICDWEYPPMMYYWYNENPCQTCVGIRFGNLKLDANRLMLNIVLPLMGFGGRKVLII